MSSYDLSQNDCFETFFIKYVNSDVNGSFAALFLINGVAFDVGLVDENVAFPVFYKLTVAFSGSIFFI